MLEGEEEPGGENGRWEKGKCHVGELRLVIGGDGPIRNQMKLPLKIAAVLLAMNLAGRVHAQENPYDVLGKALLPIAGIFVPNANGELAPHALVLDAHLLQASKLPPELQGQAVHIAVLTPDSVLVQAPIAGQILTVCRAGDTLWAAPASKIQPLLAQPSPEESEKKKKKRKSEAAKLLGPLVLPVRQKDLVFLPVLFQVADAGNDTVAGAPCRVLDVQLMSQLAAKLHAENWTGRVWVGADYGIVQIALTGPDWSGTVSIDKLAFPAQLPDGAFQPPATDALQLTPAQFLNLLGQVGRK